MGELSVLLDLADATQFSANLMLRNSPLHSYACGVVSYFATLAEQLGEKCQCNEVA
jgi:hypothetical protein